MMQDDDDITSEQELDESYAAQGQFYDDKYKEDLDEHIANSIDEYNRLHGGPTPDYYFHKTGDFWLISFAGRRAFIENIKGMVYLKIILKNNQREIPLLELCQYAGEIIAISTTTEKPQVKKNTTFEVFDESSRKDYDTRIKSIRDWLDLFSGTGQPDEEKYRKEYEDLIKHVKAGTTHKKRIRRVDPDHERNRRRVGKNIVQAIERIKMYIPECGEHLDSEIETGSNFCYKPSHQKPWNF